jgi:trans-2-enoyl-CoA reductase
VIQLARARGLKTVNVVRRREGGAMQDLEDRLRALGADTVVTEDEFAKDPLRWVGSDGVKLALNCVGGKTAIDQCKALRRGGVLALYGGMSGRPLMVGSSQLIFQDLTIKGFWLSTWLQQHSETEFSEMLRYLIGLHSEGRFRLDVEKVPLEHVVEAVASARLPHRSAKIVLQL